MLSAGRGCSLSSPSETNVNTSSPHKERLVNTGALSASMPASGHLLPRLVIHPGVAALLQETANAHGEGMDVGQEVVETGPEAGVRFGGPLFATPGLTPIHPAQQTPDQADQGLGVGDGARAGTATTPSTFLSGLLRGSPDTAAIADATSRLETPLASRHHEEEEGGELLSMGAAGAGATRMAAAGLGTSVVGDGGEGAGAGGRGMTRRTSRGGGGGGRRVGGRLSFSSAVGTEDGSGGEGSEGGVRGGGTGSSAEEKASRAPPRTHASRYALTNDDLFVRVFYTCAWFLCYLLPRLGGWIGRCKDTGQRTLSLLATLCAHYFNACRVYLRNLAVAFLPAAWSFAQLIAQQSSSRCVFYFPRWQVLSAALCSGSKVFRAHG